MKYYIIHLSKMLCDIEECGVIKETDKMGCKKSESHCQPRSTDRMNI